MCNTFKTSDLSRVEFVLCRWPEIEGLVRASWDKGVSTISIALDAPLPPQHILRVAEKIARRFRASRRKKAQRAFEKIAGEPSPEI